MSTIYTLSDRLADILQEPRMERLERCTQFAQPLNMNAFTEQERKWIAEGEAALASEAARTTGRATP